ncbi:MAG: glycosyltransferase family 2 protein [Arenicella sp.]|nr:glycosyltransferase family 2 protein [Arenicella sp.]
MIERVLAVVVSYNPDGGMLSAALQELLKQGCDVAVIDNGSNNLNDVEDLISAIASDKLVLLSQSSNRGLGAAHNIGIKQAKAGDYNYLLIMDQDSLPLEGMVDKLVVAHKAKSLVAQVSAVGVSYLNVDNGSESFFVRFGALKFARHYCRDKDSDGCIEADFLISSGSLISVQAIESIGEMDEGLFIDHVDTEWFLRARHKGYMAYGACDAVMRHGLGENTHTVSFGGRQRNVPQHKSFRYYYIFRNSIILYKRGYTSGLWKWNDIQRLAMIGVMFGLVKTPRRANAAMMLKGIWHGLLGRQGPLPEALVQETEVGDG